MYKYRLSQAAHSSLADIAGYSCRQFGLLQTEKYMEKLRNRIRWLAEQPHFGRDRSDVKPGYFSYFEGSHTIFYVHMEEEVIGIIDILHQSMDPLIHLQIPPIFH